MPDSKKLADRSSEKPQTRREKFEAAGAEMRLPDCAADFLIVHLLEIGPVVATGMGTSPAGWRDVQAWQACTGACIPVWQAKLLVELAREYHAFSHEAAKPDCPPPWTEEGQTESRRDAIAQSLRLGFRAMMMVQTQKGA